MENEDWRRFFLTQSICILWREQAGVYFTCANQGSGNVRIMAQKKLKLMGTSLMLSPFQSIC